jgi:hypothetical protein
MSALEAGVARSTLGFGLWALGQKMLDFVARLSIVTSPPLVLSPDRFSPKPKVQSPKSLIAPEAP